MEDRSHLTCYDSSFYLYYLYLYLCLLARASISLSSSLGPLRHCQTRLSELRGVLVRRDDIEPLRGLISGSRLHLPIAYIFCDPAALTFGKRWRGVDLWLGAGGPTAFSFFPRPLSELRGVLVRLDGTEPLRGVDFCPEASSPARSASLPPSRFDF